MNLQISTRYFSKWISSQWPSWVQSLCHERNFPLPRSAFEEGALSTRALEERKLQLEHYSVSTCGLLHLISRWAFTLKGSCRVAASQLLDGMLSAGMPSSWPWLVHLHPPTEVALCCTPIHSQHADLLCRVQDGLLHVEPLAARVPQMRQGALRSGP